MRSARARERRISPRRCGMWARRSRLSRRGIPRGSLRIPSGSWTTPSPTPTRRSTISCTRRACPPTTRWNSRNGTTRWKCRSRMSGDPTRYPRRKPMIPLNRYPREITLRDGARLTLRPMSREDVDRLWDFFRRIPPEDKMFFREDVTRKEVVERWAEHLDYDSVLPILALEGDRVVGDATLHRKKNGWKQAAGEGRGEV